MRSAHNMPQPRRSRQARPREERDELSAHLQCRGRHGRPPRGLGRAAKAAFIDPNETLSYGELAARSSRMANLLATYGIPREPRVALLLLDTVDFPGGVLGRHQGRRGAGVPQHAAHCRAVRLHPGRQPRQGAVRLGAAAARGAAHPRPAAVPQARVRGRRRAPVLRPLPPRRARLPARRDGDRRHLLRRDRVLALLVGLHRHAQGRAARAFEPDGDGAAHRPGLPRHARGRPRLLGGQAVLRLRPRQRHDIPPVRRRHRRAAAGAADAGVGVRHAQAASADVLLRRPHPLQCHAGLPAGHAREQLSAPAHLRLRRRGAPRRGGQGVRAPGSASISSTASAPPRCCTSTCATAPAP